MGQEREESLGFYEMLWDCDHCDTKGLLAKSQRYCANCGAPQNPDKRYFPKEGQEQRIDGHAFEGADRTCPACGAPQSANAKNCTNCGSILDGAAEVRGFVAAPAAPAPRAPARKRSAMPWLIALVAIFGGGFGVWWRCLRSQEAQVVVAAHKWQRVIAVEEFNERTEEAWRNQVPIDASFPSCVQRERSTRQVEDGEDCHVEKRDKKDGTFEQVRKCKPKYRSEPVTDDWCRYSARRWRQVSDVRAAGAGLSPAWPALPALGDSRIALNSLGSRREGKRTETLTLEFTGHGSCDVSDAVWRKYSDGQKLVIEVRASSGDVVCGSL
jgi:hypothetical protein